MTPEEFSNEFDILYNNIASNQAPGLNEYEKSVFLTKAQSMVVKNYFNPANNTELEGFDQTPKRQIDFSTLIASDTLTPEGDGLFDTRAKKFRYGRTKPLMVINEYATVTADGIGSNIIAGIPIPFQTYSALLSKPYKYPPKNQAWRLMMTTTESSNNRTFEVLTDPSVTIKSYYMRYIKTPEPIILADLGTKDNHLTIDNKWQKQTCLLDEELHWEILLKAVELATAVYKLGTPASDAEPQQAKEKANSRQSQRQS